MSNCMANVTCSGNGVCRADNSCLCLDGWRLSDCSQPLSALTTTPLYYADRWCFFTWYLVTTIFIANSLYRIKRVKKLEWGLLNPDKQAANRMDLQQVTMVFLFAHCLLSFIEYAIDPRGLKTQSAVGSMLLTIAWVLDTVCIQGAIFSFVRVWVAMKTLSARPTTRSLRAFDVTCGLLQIGCFIAIPFEGYWFGTIVLLFATVVTSFATWYGVRLIMYLRSHATSYSHIALRKITTLVLAMVAAVVMGMIAMLVNYLESMKVGYNLFLEGDITYRIPYSFVVLAILLALGRPRDADEGDTMHGTKTPFQSRGQSQRHHDGSKHSGQVTFSKTSNQNSNNSNTTAEGKVSLALGSILNNGNQDKDQGKQSTDDIMGDYSNRDGDHHTMAVASVGDPHTTTIASIGDHGRGASGGEPSNGGSGGNEMTVMTATTH